MNTRNATILFAAAAVGLSCTMLACSGDDDAGGSTPTNRPDASSGSDTGTTPQGNDAGPGDTDAEPGIDAALPDAGACTSDSSTCNSCFTPVEDPINGCKGSNAAVNCLPFTKAVPKEP